MATLVPEKRVTFSLISHTNVGKTTLARTLLRRDVGDTADQAHVTDISEAYTMIEAGGAELLLWDTPGFGDTARLLRRLKTSDKRLGWFVRQVWDRITDRPLWCSQQAVINVRDEADIVLYLVNAAEDPEGAGYVAMEMEILAWIGKPVVLLLNQTGPPGDPFQEEYEEAEWLEHLKQYEVVRRVLSLDAFARCWVQENELLEGIDEILPEEKRDIYVGLRGAWREKNLGVFRDSMSELAHQLVESACDGVEVSEESFLQKLGVGRGEINAEMEAARKELAQRIAGRTVGATNRLIELHQLEGQSAEKVSNVTKENFGVPAKVDESIWSAIGGLAAGATGGVLADFLAGGFTFGGGAVIGAIGGGVGSYYLAKGFNLVRGKENNVRWSKQHFVEQVHLALLSYLAVAHFGRGRGEWEDAEHPDFWQGEVKQAIDAHDAQIASVWKAGEATDADRDQMRAEAEGVLSGCATQVLKSLYPKVGIFG